MLFKAICALVLLLAHVGGYAAAGNIVQNGSFEADLQSSGSWGIKRNITGWLGGGVGVGLRNNVVGAAQDGVNFIELDAVRNSSIRQRVHITSPGSYELSFWYNARSENGRRPRNTNKIGWSFGSIQGTVLPDWRVDDSSTWTQFSQVLTFNKASQVWLRFRALGSSDGYGGLLDNITLRAVSPVPEPEAYMMFLLGLGLMGAIALRRSQQR